MDYKYILDKLLPVWGVCPFEELEDKLLSCAAKNRIPQNTKSVICALFPYSLPDEKYKNSDISRYAVVPDYHIIAAKMLKSAADELKKLFPEERFEVFIDNSPFPEVSLAVRAGVGVRGKNSLLINPDYGSWVFIGEIASTLRIDFEKSVKDSCAGCMKCVNACPTKALTSDGVDKSKCLSAITQQKKTLSPEQEELIRKTGCVWGCDICQKVCPMNKGIAYTEISEFIHGAEFNARTEGNLDDRAYMWRGKAVIERNLKAVSQDSSDDKLKF